MWKHSFNVNKLHINKVADHLIIIIAQITLVLKNLTFKSHKCTANFHTHRIKYDTVAHTAGI